jgi:DNA-binding MarR family transcriptional regulator
VYTSKKDSPKKKQSKAPKPCACTAVKKLSRALGRIYDSALAPAGINVTQYAVMRSIARHPGEPLARVAAGLTMDRTSLYRAIAPLEREGWIQLEAGSDARSRSASVTRKGAKVLDNAIPEWECLQRQLIGEFGEEEWSAFVGELRRLAECAKTITEKL